MGSPEGLEGQLSVFEAPFSVPLGSQESSTASDRAKLYAKVVFLGVGGSGRRPSRIRRPREACGAVEEREPLVRAVAYESCSEELYGEVGWGGKTDSQATRAFAALPRGMLNPLQPARTPALSEGAGSAGSRAGCAAGVRGASVGSPKAILGAIWGSPEGLEGQLSVFEAPFSVPLGFRESSTVSDRAKLYAKVGSFLGVGGSGRRPVSPPTPRGVWGSGRKRTPSTSCRVRELF